MSKVLGILEALLAVVFFGALIQHAVSHGAKAGGMAFADDAVMLLLGAVFAKLAIANLKTPVSKPDQPK